MHRLMGILEQAVGCDEDDPAGRPLGQHGAGSVETAHARHLNIHQDEVCAPQHRRVGSFAAIFRHLQDHFPLKTALDQLCKRLPLQLFVIRDQQAYHRPNPPPKVLQGQVHTDGRTPARVRADDQPPPFIQKPQPCGHVIDTDMLPALPGLGQRGFQLGQLFGWMPTPLSQTQI